MKNKCMNCNQPCKNKYCDNVCQGKRLSFLTRQKYENDPKICLNCGKIIPYEKRNENKHCSHSCAAIKNNAIFKKQKSNVIQIKNKRENNVKIKIEELKCGKISHSVTLRKYLLIVKDHKCEICQLSEWNNQKIPIEVDHIDGDSGNNNLINLRLLCPNCHAQTSTYKSRNNGKGRHKRRQRYNDGKSY